MVNYFLAKTEPHVYSIDQLRQELRTTWDGVTNPQALQAIRQMQPGDRVFIYHSGSNPGVVGMAKVVNDPTPDPRNAKSVVVDLEYLMHLEPPVSLADIKSSGKFDDWALVRQGRLSTMAVPEKFVTWIRKQYQGASI